MTQEEYNRAIEFAEENDFLKVPANQFLPAYEKVTTFMRGLSNLEMTILGLCVISKDY